MRTAPEAHMTEVAVIGGGFSGAMTALHLASRGIETTVVEPGPLGRGLAYAGSRDLLLNAPSTGMSAFADRPDDFAVWLAERGDQSMFAARASYGDYLADRIAAAGFDVVASRARRVTQTARGFAIACENGRKLSARAVVFALGNAPSRSPDIEIPETHHLADPYRAADAIADRHAPIALLGTGLTAFDVICGLRQRGHRGPILAVSRRGLTPLTFAPTATTVEVPRELVRQPRLEALLAWWRSRWLYDIGDAAIASALRPVMPVIWRRLPSADRERFVRHVRPRWEVIRHRAPPAIAAIVGRARAEGALEITAGKLVATVRVGELLRCTFVTPRKTMLVRDVRYVVNCTGPERDVTRQSSPLVRSLLAAGLIDPDPLRLGVQTTADGQLIGAGGPIARAYAVGPWRIADAFESTAVPELRVQASETAAAIATR